MTTSKLKSAFFFTCTLALLLFASAPSRAQIEFSEHAPVTGKERLNDQTQLPPWMMKTGVFNIDQPYRYQDFKEIQAAIGNSKWWDGLPREAQNEIRQKMQALPDAPTFDNLQEILAISWEGQAIERTPGSVQSKTTCPEGDVFLASQDEVDAFGALGCTQVTGDLYIDDTESDQKITDLTPLHNLETVDGVFLITTSQLTSLEGLSNLTTVGYLRILTNEALTSLEGLSGITAFTGPVTGCGCSYLVTNNFIAFNPLIEDLSGLDNLTTVNSGFYISANNSLKNLNGLQQYSYSAAGLDVANHPALTSLQGLSGLETVQGNLVIRLNPGLKNLVGLSNLSVVGNTVIIDRNATLKNLAGLSSLTSIPGALWIEGNDDLHNIAALSGISSLGSILIWSNPVLKNLSGLNSVSSVDVIDLYDNASLKNVDALSNITSVNWITLQVLPSLENIDGLSNLSSVAELIGFADCPLLENLDALSNLTQVDGLLGAVFMGGLQNLDGLSNVQSVGWDLWVFSNPSLTSCCGIYQLLCTDPPACTSDAVSGNIVMYDNGSGCTPDDIIAGGACSPAPENNMIVISGEEELRSFSVYPNPVGEEMTISLESFATGPAQVKLINSLGETLWLRQITDVSEVFRLNVDLKSIPSVRSGMYFVTVIHGGATHVRQVVIQD